MNHLLHDPLEVDRLSVGCQPHDLVLGAVDLEAQVVGEGAVEEPQAVGEADLLEQLDVRAPAHAVGGGGPLPDAVDGQDRRLLVRGRKEGGGRMAHVVLGVEDRPGVGLELLADRRGHPQLLVEPDRHGLAERVERAGEGGDVGREHPLELEKRLVVEADGVEVLGADPGLGEDVLDGLGGEVGVVALAGEALLLGRRDHLAVLQEGGGGVVVEAGQSENVSGHQNWCLAARSGPRGLGSWACQNEVPGSRLRSRGSWPNEPHAEADGAHGQQVDDGEDDGGPNHADSLEEARPAGIGPGFRGQATEGELDQHHRRGESEDLPSQGEIDQPGERVLWAQVLVIPPDTKRVMIRRVDGGGQFPLPPRL